MPCDRRSSSSSEETRTSSKRSPGCTRGPWTIPSSAYRGSRIWICGNSSAGMTFSRMRSVRRLSKFEPGNRVIWLPLLRKKTQLRKVKRTLDIEERMLFHGTGHSNIQAICTFNFDWRLTGSHGDVYGKGTGPPPCDVTLLKTNILIVFGFFVVLFATSTHRKLLCPRCQVLQ